MGPTTRLSLSSAQWLLLQLVYQPEGSLQSCLAHFRLWFAVLMMWVNLGIKKLELILGSSCTSEEHRCAELIGQLTGHFPYWGSFVRLALLLIYSVPSASELLILLHCLSLCGFILYYPWPIMTHQAVNTCNEIWAAFFWQSCKKSSFHEISSSPPDPVCFIKVWVDNSNQHLTCSENTIALRANLASEVKACKIAGKKSNFRAG